jgi:hypothetical protein
MKYGLLVYSENKNVFNVGDHIQSLAARQYLPKVDTFIDRDAMALYHGDPIRIILNGWFTHNVHNWIPTKEINPLFISFHLNSSSAPFMLDEKGIAYLKQYEPIGCRDKFTVGLLEQKEIKAYFSGCLTLTLDNYKVADSERGNDIYIVDPLYNYPNMTKLSVNWKFFLRGIIGGDIFKLGKRSRHLRKIFTSDLLRKAKYETQVFPNGKYSDTEKFAIAESLLKKYAKAKLVITSRIHCALPCLALGTPVIFINGFDSFIDTCRFDGLLELFNCVNVDTAGHIKANFDLPGKIDIDTMVTNRNEYKLLAENLRKKCTSFSKKNN